MHGAETEYSRYKISPIPIPGAQYPMGEISNEQRQHLHILHIGPRGIVRKVDSRCRITDSRYTADNS